MERSEADKQASQDPEFSSSSSISSSIDQLNVELKQCGPKDWSDLTLYNFQPSNVSLIFSRNATEGQNWILFAIYPKLRYNQLREIARGSPQLFDLGDVNEIYGDLKIVTEQPKAVEHIPLSDVVQNLIDGRAAAGNQKSNPGGATLEVENNGTATLHVPANTWPGANTGTPNSSSTGSQRPNFGNVSSSTGSQRPNFGSVSSSTGSQPLSFAPTNPFANLVNPSFKTSSTPQPTALTFSAGSGAGTSSATPQPQFSASSGAGTSSAIPQPPALQFSAGSGAGNISARESGTILKALSAAATVPRPKFTGSTSSTGSRSIYSRTRITPPPTFGTGPSSSTPVRKTGNVPGPSSKLPNGSGSVARYTFEASQPQTQPMRQQQSQLQPQREQPFRPPPPPPPARYDVTAEAQVPLPDTPPQSPPLSRQNQPTGAGPSNDELAMGFAQAVVDSDLIQPGASGVVAFGGTPPAPTKEPVGLTREGEKVTGLVTSTPVTQDTASGPLGFTLGQSLLDIDYESIEEVPLMPTIATTF